MEWISIKDNLPEEGHMVLYHIADCQNVGHRIGYYLQKDWLVWMEDVGYSYCESREVTHWMPLPKAPEEK